MQPEKDGIHVKKTMLCLLIVFSILTLPACGGRPGDETLAAATTTTSQTEAPTVPATVPPDGSPLDVTCKGTYTGQPQADTVVAQAADAQLTSGELQAWYWAEVADYLQSGQTPAPDVSRDLATQPCEIDASVRSWQQYFLRRALNRWHTSQALIRQGQEEGLPVEEAFQPNLDNYAKYMEGMPATKYLYRYEKSYQPNSIHQAYLDSMADTLSSLAQARGYDSGEQLAQEALGTSLEDLTAFAVSYNQGYMYFADLSCYLEPQQDQVEDYYDQNREALPSQDGSRYVDIRHILLIPEGDAVTVAEDGTVSCSEEQWESCYATAEEMLSPWTKGLYEGTESAFADLAYHNSADAGSAPDGGAYRQISQGQLIPELDSWCFDQSRQPGDTAIIRSPYGCHLIYFVGSTDAWYAQAVQGLTVQLQQQLLQTARDTYPMEADYSAITLGSGSPEVSYADVLYPDVAHERFPEIPLYLQQDYPKTMYGGFKISTNGCGITTMAMIASYLGDEEWTPPEMCQRYGNYSFANGTDGGLFVKEPPLLGFFLKEKTYDPNVALEALKEGRVVVSIQHKGYWTRGGHYIALEKINEDGTIQVRDSNLYNYGRISSHKEDKHTWGSITSAGSGYWIFEYKVTSIPACSRCGGPEGVTQSLLQEDYQCRKCRSAALRRSTYLLSAE